MRYQAMNAATCKDLQKLIDSGDYIAEIKLDGYRAIAENGLFYSRLGNILPVPIKTPANLVLDGELIIPGGNSNDVNSALGAKGDKTLLRYVIFDILEIDGQDLTNLAWSERRAILDGYRKNIHLPLLGGDVTRPMADIQYALQIAHDYQHEGIMLKNINAVYQQGKRPANNWYKLKKHDTADVKITGFVPGTGKNKGLVGSIAFVDENGRTGAAGGLTDAQRIEFTAKQAELIGAVMEIGYMELFGENNNSYRHPVFKCLRTDKKL